MQPDQRGGPATAACSVPDLVDVLDDQAIAIELVDDRDHRRAGQPGCARQLAATRGAVVSERVQQRRDVALAQLFRRAHAVLARTPLRRPTRPDRCSQSDSARARAIAPSTSARSARITGAHRYLPGARKGHAPELRADRVEEQFSARSAEISAADDDRRGVRRRAERGQCGAHEPPGLHHRSRDRRVPAPGELDGTRRGQPGAVHRLELAREGPSSTPRSRGSRGCRTGTALHPERPTRAPARPRCRSPPCARRPRGPDRHRRPMRP